MSSLASSGTAFLMTFLSLLPIGTCVSWSGASRPPTLIRVRQSLGKECGRGYHGYYEIHQTWSLRMSPLLEELKATASTLPAPERAELAHFLLETLEPAEEGVAEAWQAELTRRMADIRSG